MPIPRDELFKILGEYNQNAGFFNTGTFSPPLVKYLTNWLQSNGTDMNEIKDFIELSKVLIETEDAMNIGEFAETYGRLYKKTPLGKLINDVIKVFNTSDPHNGQTDITDSYLIDFNSLLNREKEQNAFSKAWSNDAQRFYEHLEKVKLKDMERRKGTHDSTDTGWGLEISKAEKYLCLDLISKGLEGSLSSTHKDNLITRNIGFPLLMIIMRLKSIGLATSENCSTLLLNYPENLSDIYGIIRSLDAEDKSGRLLKDNFIAILRSRENNDDLITLLKVIRLLHEAKLFSVDNRNNLMAVFRNPAFAHIQIAQQQNYDFLALFFIRLEALVESNLLNQNNLNDLCRAARTFTPNDIYNFVGVMEILRNRGMLTQNNFDAFIRGGTNAAAAGSIIITFDRRQPTTRAQQLLFLQRSGELNGVLQNFQRLPDHAFEREFITAFINLVETVPAAELTQRLNALINRTMAALPQRPANAVEQPRQRMHDDAQSTHVASVHKSVSASAMRLQKHCQQLDYQKNLKELQSWGNDLLKKDDQKVKAAGRGVTMVTSLDAITGGKGDYIDPVSQIKLQRLAVIIWNAIKDNSARWIKDPKSENPSVVSVQEALEALQRGYYEIAQEYNLDAKGVPLNENPPDKPACAPGSFNKLVEVMVSILKEAEVLFITKEYASLQLLYLARFETVTYLANHPSELEKVANKENYDKDKATYGIGPVWDKIKKKVADDVYKEYGSVYPPDQSNAEFQAMLAVGDYLEIPEKLVKNLVAAQVKPAQVESSPPSPPPAPQQPEANSESTEREKMRAARLRVFDRKASSTSHEESKSDSLKPPGSG